MTVRELFLASQILRENSVHYKGAPVEPRGNNHLSPTPAPPASGVWFTHLAVPPRFSPKAGGRKH